jgi:hypothetical protein
MRAIASLGYEGSLRAIASSMLPHVPPRQGSTPIFVTATADGITTVQTCVSAAAKALFGADPMAAPVMGDGAPAEEDAPTEDDRDEAEDEVEDSVGDGPEKTPTQIIAIAACMPWWALTPRARS